MKNVHRWHAVLPLAMAASCATSHPSLRFRDTADDYAALGLSSAAAAREDGRRSRPATDDFEWWYVDGVADDGTVIVAVFSDNWLPGSHIRRVTLEVTPPHQPTKRGIFSTQDAGVFANDKADVTIGGHHLAGNLDRYTITIDPATTGGVGCQLQLDRRAPSFRPGTGILSSGEEYFGWFVAVPQGALSGTITVDGRTTPFHGSGYHDHNWGNVPPWNLMRNWWWGRGEVGGHTVVMSEIRPRHDRGQQKLALLYVAGPDGVLTDAHGASARLIEGPPKANDDPHHPEQRAAFVILETADATSVRFERHGEAITSYDLLASRPWIVRQLAAAAGRSPWYTRWRAHVALDAKGAATQGEGTIEFMSFE